MQKALFLDRDGVVNRELGYLSRVDQVEWLPGIWQLCAAAHHAGYLLIIVTNQSGIARGLYSEADFHALMAWMQVQFQAHSVPLAAYYFCPHHPVHGVGLYQRECPCRKPAPGMLLQAAQDHNLDLARSIMVGDRCSDVAAANAAGLRKMFLLAGTEQQGCPGDFVPIQTLPEVTQQLTALS